MSAPVGVTLHVFGDSLSAGTGAPKGHDFARMMSRLFNITAVNHAVPGASAQEVLTQLLTAGSLANQVVTIWCGHNNGVDTTAIKASIASMVAALPASAKYLVLSQAFRTNETAGTAGRILFTAMNNELAALYGSNFLDVTTVTDATPRVDSIHFATYGPTGRVLGAKIVSMGWMTSTFTPAQLIPTPTILDTEVLISGTDDVGLVRNVLLRDAAALRANYIANPSQQAALAATAFETAVENYITQA